MTVAILSKYNNFKVNSFDLQFVKYFFSNYFSHLPTFQNCSETCQTFFLLLNVKTFLIRCLFQLVDYYKESK